MTSKKSNTQQKLVSVIIPTYNESASIKKMIHETKELHEQFPVEIIVIDANSTDNTAQIAEDENVKVIRRNKKYGKGADFWYAAQKATGDYIVQIDADLQFDPKEIPLLVTALDKGADVALAWRITHKEAPFIRTLGNIIFCTVTSIIIGKRINDVVAGFKAFRKDALLSLHLQESHFGYEGEVVVKAVRLKYKIAQVPVNYKPRLTGKSQVNPLKDGPLTIWSILKARFVHLS